MQANSEQGKAGQGSEFSKVLEAATSDEQAGYVRVDVRQGYTAEEAAQAVIEALIARAATEQATGTKPAPFFLSFRDGADEAGADEEQA